MIAFLPAAGEVHLTRDGRLLSVQNFAMGNHEVDTRGLPYGIYDVEVEVIVNGRVVSKRTQRVNKLFSRDAAPARRWRGRYGAAVFIWIAGQRAGKRPGRRRELAGRPFGLRVAQHPELGGYGLWLRQPGCGGNPPDATAGRVDQR